MLKRPRRLRISKAMRNLVRETKIDVDDLIYPLFVVEGENIKEEIPSLPDVYHFSVDMLEAEIKEIVELGIEHVIMFGIPGEKDAENIKEEIPSLPDVYHFSVDMLEAEIKEIVELGIEHVIMFGIPGEKDACGSEAFADNGIVHYHFSVDMLEAEIKEIVELGIEHVIMFGIPGEKDACGSEAFADNGIVQRAVRKIKEVAPEMNVITDVCMCQYTSHGHCGILTEKGYVDNDQTLEYLAKIAVSHAKAGADMVAPSDMMDGRIVALRNALDENGFETVGIMAYSAKYASSFYGPFRDAANSAP